MAIIIKGYNMEIARQKMSLIDAGIEVPDTSNIVLNKTPTRKDERRAGLLNSPKRKQ